MIDSLLERVRRFWRLLTRRFSKRPKEVVAPGFPLGGMPEPAEYARGLPWVPRGDGQSFNPRDNHVLKKLQRRATYALFAELGQKWVPAEVFRILDGEALPTKAVEIFCKELGLDIEQVKRRSVDELARLTESLDVLFILHDIGHRLPPASRDKIVAAMRAHDYRAAAGMIDVFRLALRALDDAVEMEGRIPFQAYRPFLTFLRGFGDDWLRLSLQDVKAALEGCRRYRDLNERFDHAIFQLDARIEWVLNYGGGSRRGSRKDAAPEEMIKAKREAEQKIRTAEDWDLVRLEVAIAALEQLVDDFGKLHAESTRGRERKRDSTDQAEHPPRRDGVEIWTWALAALGFDDGMHPDPAEIRTAFCRQAMRYHPDRNADQSDTVQQYYRDKFEEAAKAREILDRGPPAAAIKV